MCCKFSELVSFRFYIFKIRSEHFHKKHIKFRHKIYLENTYYCAPVFDTHAHVSCQNRICHNFAQRFLAQVIDRYFTMKIPWRFIIKYITIRICSAKKKTHHHYSYVFPFIFQVKLAVASWRFFAPMTSTFSCKTPPVYGGIERAANFLVNQVHLYNTYISYQLLTVELIRF